MTVAWWIGCQRLMIWKCRYRAPSNLFEKLSRHSFVGVMQSILGRHPRPMRAHSLAAGNIGVLGMRSIGGENVSELVVTVDRTVFVEFWVIERLIHLCESLICLLWDGFRAAPARGAMGGFAGARHETIVMLDGVNGCGCIRADGFGGTVQAL
ncbi:hypothetical protein EDB85DRAFT_1955821 [Lactarius pseudohatsudake]|nr:hypothetical protein EDB85DRAFT_1955821 [Lactarius pseudohatsudake]